MTDTPSAGHNSGAIHTGRLKSFVERIERLEAEKAELAADIREVYQEAKGEGFDTRVIRQMVRDRKLSPQELEEREAIVDTYRRALGMYAGTPLGAAALRVAEAVRDGTMAIEVKGA